VSKLVFVQNNQVVTDSLTIADMFSKRHDHVLRDIRTQMEYSGDEFALLNFGESNYKNSQNKDLPKIDLTEEAFTLVAMSYNTKEAVQMKIKFIQEFKRMKDHIQKELDATLLSPELQMFNQMFKAIANNEIEQKRLNKEIEETKQQVHNISEIVALNSIDWRKETTEIINKIARKTGEHGQYQQIRKESYQLLEERAKCNLQIRLQNKRHRLMDEGAAKSKIDKTSKLDVIEEDKRLLEIYLAVVKEMAIKYKVQINTAS